MDAIPIYSQLKSLIQAISGQKKKARITQENFSRQCPIISQSRSFVEWAILKDSIAAKETQKQCGKFVSNLVNGIPVVGHIKGTVHYIVGDKIGGEYAMKAASRTTIVITAAVGGAIVAGPAGAIGAATVSGLAYDGTVTAIDSVRHDTFTPYGVVEPLADPTDAGKWCDAVAGVALDAVTGYATARVVTKIQLKRAAGATAEQIVREIGTPEEKIAFVPAEIFNQIKSVVVKAHAGYLYIMKDGTLIRIKEELLKKYAQYKSENTSNEKTDVLDADRSISLDEIQVIDNNGATCIYISGRLFVIVRQGKKFIPQSDGSFRELVENQPYVLDEKSNEMSPVTNSSERKYINSLIMSEGSAPSTHARSRSSSVCSDVESVYHECALYMSDDEEEHLGLIQKSVTRLQIENK